MEDIVQQDIIEKKIFLIRGLNVMLDRDIVELYGVETKYLTRQVRRNIKRFPEDFMFRLTRGNYSAIVILNTFAFTFLSFRTTVRNLKIRSLVEYSFGTEYSLRMSFLQHS